MNRAAHEFGRARNREAGDKKLEKDAEGEWRREERKGGIYRRRESNEACAPAPCPI